VQVTGIEASALSLSAIGDASYAITVRNSDPAPNNIVWTKAGITSATFGNNAGAISYVGPCDSLANPHKIELVLKSISEPSGATIPPSTFNNPAPPGRPAVLTIDCVENSDVSVVFNLTIMRDAQQGFFDIAVNFEDIFCSAKVDCQDALLHDGDTRGPTAVLGFACTTGTSADGAEPTWLHMTDVVLTCDGQAPLYFDPSGDVGNNGPLGPVPTAFQTAIYRSQEQLPGLDKCFWNSAIGIRAGSGAVNCHLTGQATASHATFGTTGLSPDHTIYPYVNFDVQITDGDGELSCENNALNVVGSGVQTDYTPPTGAAFAHEWECAPDTVPVDKRLACEGSFAGGTTVNALPTPDGMSITMGGVRSLPYTLPANTFIGNDATCCVNPCCDASAGP